MEADLTKNGKVIAYQRLKELLDKATAMGLDMKQGANRTEWQSNVESALERLFSPDSRHIKSFKGVSYLPMMFSGSTPQSDFDRVFLSGLNHACGILRAAMKEFEDYELAAAKASVFPIPSPPAAGGLQNPKVFVVHGHDHALKADVEVFLKNIGLDPIVLHRQADKGQTIIEKFLEHSDVGYAFILLTPDDIAYGSEQANVADRSRKKEFRARQNVIFEFGFFVGRIGRERVCCIYKEGVVLPSDLNGLIYKKVTDSIDSQALSIARDLRAAGYKVTL